MKRIWHSFELIVLFFVLIIYFIITASRIIFIVCKSLLSLFVLLCAIALAAYIAFIMGLQFFWLKIFKYTFRMKKQTEDNDFLFDNTNLKIRLNSIRFKQQN